MFFRVLLLMFGCSLLGLALLAFTLAVMHMFCGGFCFGKLDGWTDAWEVTQQGLVIVGSVSGVASLALLLVYIHLSNDS